MVHDLIPLRFPQVVFRNAAHRVYYNALIRAAVRRADAVLTNSQFSKGEIVSGLGVDENKVHPIKLGVEQAPLIDPQHAEAVLQRYGLKKPFVLALGSTEPRKNNARVIEALRMLSLQHPRLRLAIAGAPWRGRMFEPAQIDARVRLLGFVPDEDLRAIMSAAALLVFPSLHEGFGLPVLEAMALGVPVVTSLGSALPEVAGDAAVYADPLSTPSIAAQMHRVLSDAELAASMSARGRARAQLFRWQDTCAQITEVCAGLAESPTWVRQAVTH
jgi:alpha-1,3-rhamnosyl/mannosyltransferase